MSATPVTARDLARRLVDREASDGGASATQALAAARAGEELFRALSRWIGSDGCHALFTRARAQELATHPPLDSLQLNPRHDPYLLGVEESTAEYGNGATANAIESMIVGMIELLGRLIGVDMATTLIERSLSEYLSDNSSPAKRRAEA